MVVVGVGVGVVVGVGVWVVVEVVVEVEVVVVVGVGVGVISVRLESLRVYETDLHLVRCGKPNDGGYIIPDDVQIDFILSGGIADENSFEDHALSIWPNVLCAAYDPHGGPGPAKNLRYSFHKSNVGHLGLMTKKSVLVKIDIEGGEWDWFRALNDEQLGNIAVLVAELHDMGNRSEADWEQLARIAKTHALVWVHGNSWDTLVEVDGVQIPKTLECTWVLRGLPDSIVPSKRNIPCSLDMSNLPNRPDLQIDWEPFVAK